jgi:hypothetical protein
MIIVTRNDEIQRQRMMRRMHDVMLVTD